MKNIITIALIALGICTLSACSNKSEMRIKELTDSLNAERKANTKLHNERDSLGHKLLLTTLTKVAPKYYDTDTIAIIDTTSYKEYLAQLKKIDSVYGVQYKQIQKSEDELDRINDEKRAAQYRRLFNQLQLTPEYSRFTQQLVYEHFSAYLMYDDASRDLLNSKYNTDWEERFNQVDAKQTSSVAWCAIRNAEKLQEESAWKLLKSKNLPLVRK